MKNVLLFNLSSIIHISNKVYLFYEIGMFVGSNLTQKYLSETKCPIRVTMLKRIGMMTPTSVMISLIPIVS